MIDVEVFGEDLAPDAPPLAEVRRLCDLTAQSRGVAEAHVAVEYVTAARIATLNDRHRGKAEPTDVLSFPIDGVEVLAEVPGGQREHLDAVDRERQRSEEHTSELQS